LRRNNSRLGRCQTMSPRQGRDWQRMIRSTVHRENRGWCIYRWWAGIIGKA
jgi:hypothetical protein